MTFDGRAPGTDPARWQALIAALDVLPLPAGRVLVVAAHADDETLGAGGLIAELAAAGRPAHVVVVTDGSASHPGSPTVAPGHLAVLRAAEVRAAVRLLSPDSSVDLLDVPDGQVRESRDAVHAALAEVVRAVAPDVLVAPWRGDGHRDHRVVGEVCAELAARAGCTLLEYPIWLWHWGVPDDPTVPRARLRALPLADRSVVLRRRALATHRSQVEPLSGAPEDAAALHPRFQAGFDRDVEVLLVPDPPAPSAAEVAASGVATPDGPEPGRAPEADLPVDYFEATYARHADPWGFTDRWYERRKRALTLAALPDERYGRGLEIGCSIGVLTADLAERCDELVAVDLAPAAVARARERLTDRPHVRVEVGDLAGELPAGPFDLVVLSEVGYYLTRPHLAAALDRIGALLGPAGSLIACHWRHPVRDYPLTGDDVHRTLARATTLTRLVHHEEADLVLDVYGADPRSVAARTGLL